MATVQDRNGGETTYITYIGAAAGLQWLLAGREGVTLLPVGSVLSFTSLVASEGVNVTETHVRAAVSATSVAQAHVRVGVLLRVAAKKGV